MLKDRDTGKLSKSKQRNDLYKIMSEGPIVDRVSLYEPEIICGSSSISLVKRDSYEEIRSLVRDSSPVTAVNIGLKPSMRRFSTGSNDLDVAKAGKNRGVTLPNLSRAVFDESKDNLLVVDSDAVSLKSVESARISPVGSLFRSIVNDEELSTCKSLIENSESISIAAITNIDTGKLPNKNKQFHSFKDISSIPRQKFDGINIALMKNIKLKSVSS